MSFVNHGKCNRCGFDIICDYPFDDHSGHDFLLRHIDALDCIQLLRTELNKKNLTSIKFQPNPIDYGNEF